MEAEAVFMNYSIRLLLSIIVIILLIYIVYKFRANRGTTRSSLDIMKERFERGEISKEAYERAKKQQGKK